jgi:hypothetical protein
LYKEFWDQLGERKVVHIGSKKTGNVGAKSDLTEALAIALIEYNYRIGHSQTLRRFTIGFNRYIDEVGDEYSYSTVRRWLKCLGAKVGWSHVKPTLTAVQKLQRLQFIIDKVENGVIGLQFKSQLHILHCDEKWFYAKTIRRPKRTLHDLGYLGDDDEQLRPDDAVTRHKSHIEKIMFLAVSDLNKLDLCLFNSLQKRSDEIRDENERYDGVPGIIEAVRHCWEAYEPEALSRVHALQHVIFRAVLENEGGNQYDVPHTRITWRQRHGENPLDRIVPLELYNKAQDAIDEILNVGADNDDAEDDIDDAEEEQVEQVVI